MVSTSPALSRPAPAVPQPLAAVRASATATTCCTSMVPTAALTPTMMALCSPAPVPAIGLPPCRTGGVRVPRGQEKVRKLVSTLETALEGKDLAITKMIKKHEAALVDKQRKYNALYFHCTELANELRRKDALLDCLREADRTQKTLYWAQQQLARSTLALAKNHRTKLTTDRHQLHYRSTDSSPEVLQEINLATERIRAEQAKKERAKITKLSEVVDRLAAKYDRYNMIPTSNILNTRCDPDGLPCIVPRDMMGLWLFADIDLEPTEEERAMYEFHLQKEVRGPPIYSPNLPRPTVNWNTLNKHKRKNLPDPEVYAIQSVPADLNFYLDTAKFKPYALHRSHDRPSFGLPVRISAEECGCAVCVPPFGRMYGLMTDMGVISMPDTNVHGYRWDENTAGWVIATGG